MKTNQTTTEELPLTDKSSSAYKSFIEEQATDGDPKKENVPLPSWFANQVMKFLLPTLKS
jgi:hypothetical protein